MGDEVSVRGHELSSYGSPSVSARSAHRTAFVRRAPRYRHVADENGSPAGVKTVGTPGTKGRRQAATSFIPWSSDMRWPRTIMPLGRPAAHASIAYSALPPDSLASPPTTTSISAVRLGMPYPG